ncbi:MAG: S9 family peptidase [Bacteroidetes bacterium]|nr:S9 family peptidase [Bacteroidota bacterium]
MKAKSLFPVLISLIFSFVWVHAQTVKKSFAMEDQIELNVPSNAVISPKGDKALFSIRKGDLNTSQWVTQVYLLDVKTKKYYQFTQDGKSCSNPKFSPDEKWITFISSREYFNKETNAMESKASQLWAAPTYGGEALNWTSLPGGVDEYVWSNDSKKIAILSERYDEKEEEHKAELKKKKLDVEVYPQKNTDKVLYIFDAEKKEFISSFTLDPGVEGIRFDHQGDKVIYQTDYSGSDNDVQKFDIYSISLMGKKVQLTSTPGPETQPSYSENDKHIAFINQTFPDEENAQNDLNIMDPDGKNEINLTKEFDQGVESYIWKDSNSILFTAGDRTNTQLYQVNIQSHKIKQLTKGNTTISNLSLSSNSNELCYEFQNSTSLPEIYKDGKRITGFTSQLNQFEFGTQEVVTYKSQDDKFDVDGILFKPKDFDPSKKYPLILALHGGPYGRFQNVFLQTYGIRDFNNAGYLVFAPNPRGSSGYSDQFSQAALHDLGGGDYRDIMAGVNYIISKGFVDTSRIGVTGGSYGGYLTNWIISQTHLFKAAVSMYGIFSFFTDWSNSVQPHFEKMWFGYNYWERPINVDNLFVSRSTAFYVQNIQTPTLILHGANDVSTGLANSREMYQALHERNIPVKFVVYPRAGHGLRNEPNQYLDTIHRALAWFNRYLK